ncbi:MAG TPA: D-alanyl-D-alanine carboxypeptidase family protein [Xanthobacteraceae bacterium]|nr:D-alanyl-D-alanine carboxypeptidase family protein [Xanthobacteraceae bacterium]
MTLGSLGAATFAAAPARAESTILIDADSGKVLREQNAAYPWYPASTTKLMTLYVTLKAIRDHRITPDTLFTVSRNAYMQAPTKMGFPIGTQVTVDNALKMMMVKSANDMAVLIAEGVSGSIDKFADLMTLTAQSLGMTESNFVNPNGLPADGQITSARDLAILARALIRDFPQDSHYWHIPAIQYGKRVVRNYNPLIGRYPGADGMKTGFICASGFNLVATATRDNKHLIAVVLGAPSGAARAVKAAEMLEGGFTSNPLAWLMPSHGTVDQLKPIKADPPNLKDEMCGGHRKRPAADDEDEEAGAAEGNGAAPDGSAGGDAGNGANTGSNVTVSEATPHFSVLLSALRAPSPKNANLLALDTPVTPIVVYTGPTRPPGAPVPPPVGEPSPKVKVAHARPKAKSAKHQAEQ